MPESRVFFVETMRYFGMTIAFYAEMHRIRVPGEEFFSRQTHFNELPQTIHRVAGTLNHRFGRLDFLRCIGAAELTLL